MSDNAPPFSCTTPHGEMALRTLCMPKDTNPSGDIFGGWLLSQMDIAGAITAYRVARGRIVTVAVKEMEFHLPVYVGDTLCCYTTVERVGTTSVAVKIEAWATRYATDECFKVTQGLFVYVAVDDAGGKRVIPK